MVENKHGWAIVLLLLVLRAEVEAREFHVGANGHDANPGTPEQPFRTIRKASEILEPGDTCLVGRGVYPETVRPSRSGKFEKPIRYIAVTGETVTVTGVDQEGAEPPALGRPDGRTRMWGFDLEGRTLIEISGFDLWAVGVNLTDASYCRVENCRVWSAGGAGGIRIGGRENEVLGGSVVGGAGNGVVFLPDSVNNRASGLLVRDVSGGYGLVVCGTAQTVRHATVRDCEAGAVMCSNLYNGRLMYNDFSRTNGVGGAKPVVQITGNGKGTVLAYNWIHDDESRGGDGVLLEGPAENYLLHHNVIWGHSGSALRLKGAVQYCLVFNNTCALNGVGLDREGEARAGGAKGLRVFNNLFAGAVWPKTGGQPEEGVIWEKNYVGTSPKFVNESARQFSLAADSPCIDAGQDEPELTDAFSGVSPDAGAYEFGGDYPVPGYTGVEAGK
jgi:hypothetical protein